MRFTRPPNLPTMLLSAAAMLTLACDNSKPSTTEPIAVARTGSIEITVATRGDSVDIDRDGYTLIVDGGPSQAIDVNAKVKIGSLARGWHQVALYGLAGNCSVDVTTHEWVEIIDDAAAPVVAFSVSCSDAGDGCFGCWDW